MSTSFWKLLRLGDRAKRIVDRRGPDAPAVASYASTIHAKADAFATAREGVTKYEATWKVAMSGSRNGIGALLKVERSWVPLVVRDCAGVTSATFLADTDVPDDVLKGADRLVGLITDYVDGSNKPLPYQAAALAALNPAITDARSATTKAEAADATYQKLQKTARAAAGELDAELVLFRRTLAAAFGTEDKDYQRLRAEKVVQKEATDPADGSAPAEADGGAAGTTAKTAAAGTTTSSPATSGAGATTAASSASAATVKA